MKRGIEIEGERELSSITKPTSLKNEIARLRINWTRLINDIDEKEKSIVNGAEGEGAGGDESGKEGKMGGKIEEINNDGGRRFERAVISLIK